LGLDWQDRADKWRKSSGAAAGRVVETCVVTTSALAVRPLPFPWTEWQDPSAAYRGKPFWSWNGHLDPPELIRQIGVFQQMGMGGYFMHSRTGLQTRYLGREWFDAINACAEAGQARGLESWLYDEDRWPSGSAGGLATKELRYRMKYVRLTVHENGESDEWPAAGHFVAAFSAKVSGLDLGPYRRVERGARALPGEQLLVFAWEYMREHSFYNDTAYLDTMDPTATENFLRVTHDAYRDACGDRLGTSIRGIFTDEPHRGFVFCSSHGQPGVPDPGWTTPWTHALPEAFAAAFGYDLIDRLPELFLRPDGQRLSPVKWAYMEICQRLFLENWARPMHERCRALGLLLTGHVLHENSLAAQAVPCGSMMRYYPYLDYPGIDILGSRNECHWVVKQLSSVARQFERPWMLSELYGCTGWQTDFTDHKRIGDWQALFGINVRCHHLSWYSMAGEAKRDFPASISFQSAWYPEYAAVETYFSRLHVALTAGHPVCDVLVINPVESTWAQIHVDWAKWLQTTDPDVESLEKTYANVFAALAGAQIDFDYGDEAHLAEHGSVGATETTLRLGAMRYRVAVVAGAETLRGSTLRLLQDFRRAGGTVIFAGAPPTHLDALPSPEPAAFAADGPTAPVDGPALAAMVREHSPAARQLTLGEEGAGLFCQVRTDDSTCTAVLLNPSETRHYDNVTLRWRHAGPVTELDALTGQVVAVETIQEENGTLRWETSFRPLQERIFVCGAVLPGTAPGTIASKGRTDVLDGGFAYTLDEPNIAVLDTAEFSLDGAAWEDAREILRVEKTLSERLGVPLRGGQMVQPWAREESTTAEGTPLTLRFRFEVEHLPESPVQLALEQPREFAITLNGKNIPTPTGDAWFIDPCLHTVTLPPDALRTGTNILEMQCRYREGVDLEAVYLLGSFGVRPGPGSRVTLTELPARLGVGDWTRCGLPFYSGRIRLQLPVGSARRLALSPRGAATLVVRNPASGKTQILPWAPFACDLDGIADGQGMVEAEWVLTRRNTFGPLHLTPITQPAIGPTHFRSEGDEWSDEYQLVPVGLKEPPVIES
jgi:hypothetical protein